MWHIVLFVGIWGFVGLGFRRLVDVDFLLGGFCAALFMRCLCKCILWVLDLGSWGF